MDKWHIIKQKKNSTKNRREKNEKAGTEQKYVKNIAYGCVDDSCDNASAVEQIDNTALENLEYKIVANTHEIIVRIDLAESLLTDSSEFKMIVTDGTQTTSKTTADNTGGFGRDGYRPIGQVIGIVTGNDSVTFTGQITGDVDTIIGDTRDNKYISNLFISEPTFNNVGMVSHGGDAIIDNLGMVDPSVEGGISVGTFKNTNIYNAINVGDIEELNRDIGAGGIAANILDSVESRSEFKNVINLGKITGVEDKTSGILGDGLPTATNMEISNALNGGEVIITGGTRYSSIVKDTKAILTNTYGISGINDPANDENSSSTTGFEFVTMLNINDITWWKSTLFNNQVEDYSNFNIEESDVSVTNPDYDTADESIDNASGTISLGYYPTIKEIDETGIALEQEVLEQETKILLAELVKEATKFTQEQEEQTDNGEINTVDVSSIQRSSNAKSATEEVTEEEEQTLLEQEEQTKNIDIELKDNNRRSEIDKLIWN